MSVCTSLQRSSESGGFLQKIQRAVISAWPLCVTGAVALPSHGSVLTDGTYCVCCRVPGFPESEPDSFVH